MPRELVWWALRYLGVDEWIVSVIKAMYEDASTRVRMNGRESGAFKVKVGVEQGVSRRILESIHVVFAGRELVTTRSYLWNVLGGFTNDVVVFQDS